MPSLQVRWSEHEARKPYARPFMVTFLDDDDQLVGSIAVSGADLLYLRQFQVAVAALGGELFRIAAVEASDDPQRAWLDRLAPLLPVAEITLVTPRSSFDAERGRVFAFTLALRNGREAAIDARTLLEYQDLQSAVAHQAGQLFRLAALEEIDQPIGQRRAWDSWLGEHVARPGPDDSMSTSWPWR